MERRRQEGLGLDQIQKGVLGIPAFELLDPPADFGKSRVAHADDGIDPEEVWVKADGFLRQASAPARILEPHSGERQPIRVVLGLRALREILKVRLASPCGGPKQKGPGLHRHSESLPEGWRGEE
jgi:hypothetical protein